jgi:hypothetical protein
MSDIAAATPPGLTCSSCSGRLYPRTARRSETGWVHADHRTCLAHRRNVEARRRAQERAEDVRWMAETGECLTGAAKRLGTTAEALEKWLRLQCMDDERVTLLGREPLGLGWHRRTKREVAA